MENGMYIDDPCESCKKKQQNKVLDELDFSSTNEWLQNRADLQLIVDNTFSDKNNKMLNYFIEQSSRLKKNFYLDEISSYYFSYCEQIKINNSEYPKKSDIKDIYKILKSFKKDISIYLNNQHNYFIFQNILSDENIIDLEHILNSMKLSEQDLEKSLEHYNKNKGLENPHHHKIYYGTKVGVAAKTQKGSSENYARNEFIKSVYSLIAIIAPTKQSLNILNTQDEILDFLYELYEKLIYDNGKPTQEKEDQEKLISRNELKKIIKSI